MSACANYFEPAVLISFYKAPLRQPFKGKVSHPTAPGWGGPVLTLIYALSVLLSLPEALDRVKAIPFSCQGQGGGRSSCDLSPLQ